MGREVDHEFGDGVDDGLEGQGPGCPVMQEKVGCVRPVCEPEEEVIA